MLNWVKSRLPAGVIKAWLLARVRQLCDLGAGPLGLWLIAHHASQSQAADIVQGLGIVVLAVASWAFDLWDNKAVNGKVVTAAATGSVELANNPLARKTITAASGSPEALQQAVATLKAGLE